jgi:hypothetical protein
MTTPNLPSASIKEAFMHDAGEPLKTVAYLVTGLRSGEPSICFEDERGDYGDEDHAPAFAALCRLSDHEASIRAKDAEIDALKAARPNNAVLVPVDQLRDLQADARRYRWLRERNWFDSDLCVLREPKRVLTRGIGLGADCPSGDRLDAAIDAIKGDANGN